MFLSKYAKVYFKSSKDFYKSFFSKNSTVLYSISSPLRISTNRICNANVAKFAIHFKSSKDFYKCVKIPQLICPASCISSPLRISTNTFRFAKLLSLLVDFKSSKDFYKYIAGFISTAQQQNFKSSKDFYKLQI